MNLFQSIYRTVRGTNTIISSQEAEALAYFQFKQNLFDYDQLMDKYITKLRSAKQRGEKVDANVYFYMLCKYLKKQKYDNDSIQHHLLKGDIRQIEGLFQNNPKLNQHIDPDGYPIIYIGTKSGHFDIVQYLLEHNCRFEKKQCKSTPLHCAAYYGFVDLISLLVYYNMPNIKNQYRLYPIEEAQWNPEVKRQLEISLKLKEIMNEIAKDNLERVKQLIEKDNKKFLNLRLNKLSLLYEAAKYGSLSIAKYLLDAGFIIDFALDRDSPMHIAVTEKHLNIVNLLKDYGIEPNIKNIDGKKVGQGQTTEVKDYLLQVSKQIKQKSKIKKKKKSLANKKKLLQKIEKQNLEQIILQVFNNNDNFVKATQYQVPQNAKNVNLVEEQNIVMQIHNTLYEEIQQENDRKQIQSHGKQIFQHIRESIQKVVNETREFWAVFFIDEDLNQENRSLIIQKLLRSVSNINELLKNQNIKLSSTRPESDYLTAIEELIRLYSYNGFTALNNCFSSQNPIVRKSMSYIFQLIMYNYRLQIPKTGRPFKQQKMLYRNIRISKSQVSYKMGSIIYFTTFTSTTLNKDLTNFSKNPNPQKLYRVQFIFQMKKKEANQSALGLYIKTISVYDYEEEVLLLPYVLFYISHIQLKDDTFNIERQKQKEQKQIYDRVGKEIKFYRVYLKQVQNQEILKELIKPKKEIKEVDKTIDRQSLKIVLQNLNEEVQNQTKLQQQKAKLIDQQILKYNQFCQKLDNSEYDGLDESLKNLNRERLSQKLNNQLNMRLKYHVQGILTRIIKICNTMKTNDNNYQTLPKLFLAYSKARSLLLLNIEQQTKIKLELADITKTTQQLFRQFVVTFDEAMKVNYISNIHIFNQVVAFISEYSTIEAEKLKKKIKQYKIQNQKKKIGYIEKKLIQLQEKTKDFSFKSESQDKNQKQEDKSKNIKRRLNQLIEEYKGLLEHYSQQFKNQQILSSIKKYLKGLIDVIIGLVEKNFEIMDPFTSKFFTIFKGIDQEISSYFINENQKVKQRINQKRMRENQEKFKSQLKSFEKKIEKDALLLDAKYLQLRNYEDSEIEESDDQLNTFGAFYKSSLKKLNGYLKILNRFYKSSVILLKEQSLLIALYDSELIERCRSLIIKDQTISERKSINLKVELIKKFFKYLHYFFKYADRIQNFTQKNSQNQFLFKYNLQNMYRILITQTTIIPLINIFDKKNANDQSTFYKNLQNLFMLSNILKIIKNVQRIRAQKNQVRVSSMWGMLKKVQQSFPLKQTLQIHETKVNQFFQSLCKKINEQIKIVVNKLNTSNDRSNIVKIKQLLKFEYYYQHYKFDSNPYEDMKYVFLQVMRSEITTKSDSVEQRLKNVLDRY